MNRVALYARVSTLDQDPEMQLDELRAVARQRGWSVTEYIDHGVSGARMRRPGLDRLLADAQAGRINLVVVWRLDRLGRSLVDLLRILHDLSRWNVNFLSLRDAGIDTTTAVGRLLIQLIAAFAEFERAIAIERTRAGLARARARGVQFGRPPRDDLTAQQAEAAVAQHGSLRRAAAALGVPRATLHDRVRKSVSQASVKRQVEP